MKRKILQCVTMLLGFCGIALASATIAAAEEMPAISDVVSNVAKATMPTRNYSANIHQTVSHAILAGSVSTKTLTAQSNEVEEADYSVSCETSGALHATKGLALKRMAQTTNANPTATAPTANLRLMVTMNPINALRYVEKLPSTTITNEAYQNIPCYKVSATDQGFTFISWINKTNSYVCRQVIQQGSETLFDTQFEYKRLNGCFVPSHVVISKPSNGVRIDQDFSGHTY